MDVKFTDRYIENPLVRKVSESLIRFGAQCPEGHHPKYTMLTANGVMNVVSLTGLDHGIFCTQGFIDDNRAFVVGHVYTLDIACVFEPDAIPGKRYGFTADR